MPQCPYIFNVYLLILTPAYNALFLVPPPLASHSCHLRAASISALPITPSFSVQISLFRRGLALSSRQLRCLFTYIHCSAFHYDLLTSLPCGKLNTSSGRGRPRRASRITVNSFRLMLVEVHPRTRPLPLYVLSMSSCRFRVRPFWP